MAGTLFGLGLSQQLDVNGKPAAGALLYIYLANSTTVANAFKDYNLTPSQIHTWPIVADSTGRIPAFWLADGSYRARLTTAIGEPMFDLANMLALGPSVGGIDAAPVVFDPHSVLTTGDIKWRPGNETLEGWVKCHGGSLGPTGSAATFTGPDATHKALFTHLWNNFANPTNNAICPVMVGGVPSKGVSAESDWTDGIHVITVFDMRARGAFGLDNMGGPLGPASRLVGAAFILGGPSVPGAVGGEAVHQLAASELAAHQHKAYIRDPQHHHIFANTNGIGYAGGTNPSPWTATLPPPYTGITSDALTNVKVNSVAVGATPATDDQTAENIGTTGAAHNTMPPFVLGTWYLRL